MVSRMDEVIRKAENQSFHDPKPLQCYCQQCLVPLVPPRDQLGILDLTCPNCLQVTLVPDRGVAGFQSDSDEELEILSASLEGSVANSPVFEYPTIRVTQYCSAHTEKELDVFCETCKRAVCSQCIAKGGKHRNHDSELLEDAFKKYTKEITSSRQPLEKQVLTMQKTLVLLDRRNVEISEQRAATKESIHNTFGQLHEALHVRETELVFQVDKMAEGKLDGLATQKDRIETTLAKLNSYLYFIEETLKTGNEENVLMMKDNTITQVKELATPLPAGILTPITKADITLLAPTDLTASCRNYGQVIAESLPDPSKCQATGKGLKSAVLGEKTSVSLNFEGKRYKELIRAWESNIISETTGAAANCMVESRGRGQYEVNYQPTVKGRHQLRIKIEGQHVKGSPFSVVVKSPIEKLGAPILAINGMDGPWGVAINQKGEVVVTEHGMRRVSLFSPSGHKLWSFGTRGSGHGQFENLRGVAVDGEGNILVADSGNHRIQKFTSEGEFIAAAGTMGSGSLQLSYPIDIAFNASNKKVYVVDNGNHRIQVLSLDLTFTGTFGKKGSEKGTFKEPCGIACDSTGKVYVADRDNHCIQVFTAEGKFLRTFGRQGQGKGELDLPYYVTTDAKGMAYISEWGNNRVSVFTSEGQFVTSFGRRGDGPGTFMWPRGVAVDDIGVVYVCDGENDRVQAF